MVVKLAAVVPFGRSFDEYCQMFSLTRGDLALNILGVGDGPASFNAELTAQGGRVTSLDPIYNFDASEIRQRFDAVVNNIIDQIELTPGDWVWSYHKSPADLRTNRLKVIQRFTEDYRLNHHSGRYVTGKLPALNFGDGEFDLALCSHLLFLYSAQLSYEFHQRSVLEMLRVAREVRIFPLLTLMLERSPHLEPIQAELTEQGFTVQITQVQYELQKGGNEMLVITHPAN
ncbi:MAG: SAM-dependent methyltransferase [Leptolyngbyaceae cyanobacterium SM2_5_2]|nr:SAM-dependent methyltransferase [Leptolyngbyaceae cyanobacterium SM2_5_2]